MNSIQLELILNKHSQTNQIFLGVFARDELPNIHSYPSCFILNTANRSHPGEHWVAFYYSRKKECNFFDSYGNSPDFFKLKKYIKTNSNVLIWNKKQIQSFLSKNCGYYCVIFLIMRSSGFSMEQICDIFNDSTIKNDAMIEKFKMMF